MKNKPLYESPKVSRLDDRDSVLWGQQREICRSGSGDAYGCYTNGNNAGIVCLGDGNSPISSCAELGNSDIFG